MVTPLWEQLQEYNYRIFECYTKIWIVCFLEENIVAVITQDSVIDDNLKKQIKNQTLCTCRLLLLT